MASCHIAQLLIIPQMAASSCWGPVSESGTIQSTCRAIPPAELPAWVSTAVYKCSSKDDVILEAMTVLLPYLGTL